MLSSYCMQTYKTIKLILTLNGYCHCLICKLYLLKYTEVKNNFYIYHSILVFFNGTLYHDGYR